MGRVRNGLAFFCELCFDLLIQAEIDKARFLIDDPRDYFVS
jgi:hypothetical protein